MRCTKIPTALLAVPLCLGALACENPTETEQLEDLTNPPAPSFSFDVPGDLGNGCIDLSLTGVTQPSLHSSRHEISSNVEMSYIVLLDTLLFPSRSNVVKLLILFNNKLFLYLYLRLLKL